jgi:hypothetical protein
MRVCKILATEPGFHPVLEGFYKILATEPGFHPGIVPSVLEGSF